MQTSRRIDDADRRAPNRGGLRVALYSHDTMGLGHLRRNLLIAERLAGPELKATNLLISGAVEANFFRLPQRADCLTLPRWRKDESGGYVSGQLEVTRNELARLRASSIRSALEVFAPDLLIVDKTPTGAGGELLPAIEMLARQGKTRIVLGLRDILDTPNVVQKEWRNANHFNVIDQFFDAVWVYGDPAVYDLISECRLPDSVASKSTFTGYIDPSSRVGAECSSTNRFLDSLGERGPIVACLVGGGQDGAALARAFMEAIPEDGTIGVVVAGPLMPTAEMSDLRSRTNNRDNLHLLDFLPEADLLIERADRVVSMAGYNTVCSLLASQTDALLVPRTHPRREQLIRAERLAEMGFVDFLRPDQLDGPALRNWLLEPKTSRPAARGQLNFGGLDSICRLSQDLTGSPRLNGKPSPSLHTDRKPANQR